MKNQWKNIVQFIYDFTEVHGYPPTFREIGEGVGYKSTSSVKFQMDQLRELGRVSWVDGCARTVKVIEV